MLLNAMLNRLFRFLRRFLRRTRTINNEPLNRVSLIVIILVDIVILTNVFIGLNDIAHWHLSPSEAYPCYSNWQDYRDRTDENKDFELVRQTADPNIAALKPRYERTAADRLGKVSALCLQYAEARDAIQQPETATILEQLENKERAIATLEDSSLTIRQQYDSTLLEEIAGQPRERSINQTSAAQAQATLEENETKIGALRAEISELKNRLLNNSEGAAFLTFIKQDSVFQTVEQRYDRASFWYPSLQLLFQAIFLVPLMLGALAGYTLAQGKRYGLIALISWHLLVIFSIPLVFKVFEFLQAGAIFSFVFDLVSALFGRLLFLVSYVYILLIPLLGFGIIKFAQRFILNPRLQAAGRVQNSRCIKCAKKIRASDVHCPHCGYHQYQECGQCHQLTYKYLPHCHHCGSGQPINR